MSIDVRTLSWWDILRLQFHVTIPSALLGLVVPNRHFVGCLSRCRAGACTVRFLADLRRKYGCDRLWTLFPLRWSLFPFRWTLLVLDRDTIEAVLDSDTNAADPLLKKFAVSRFVPGALVISSGEEWIDRRRFNEGALGFRFGHEFGRRHEHANAFREVVFREAERLTAARTGMLRWADFTTLGLRISHQVILGPGQVDPELAAELARLSARGNLLLPGHWPPFAAFYARVDRYLARHRASVGGERRDARAQDAPVTASCLMHECARALEAGSAASTTRVPSQIGFWLFVLKDAVELHVARTLALIAAHPEVQERVRQELRGASLSSPQAIDALPYLDACLSEQLRLWTPVPILLRRAVKAFSLPGGVTLHPEQQILIHTGFYHRDPSVFGKIADTFSPDPAAHDRPDVYFFSRHRQSCAGQFLARFVIKAALAALLARFRFELVAPAIEPGRVPHLYDHFGIELRPVSDG
jgi:cytochrome P450